MTKVGGEVFEVWSQVKGKEDFNKKRRTKKERTNNKERIRLKTKI